MFRKLGADGGVGRADIRNGGATSAMSKIEQHYAAAAHIAAAGHLTDRYRAGAVNGGRQPGEVASGARHLVLRDLPAVAQPGGLPAVRSGIRLPVQLLLRGAWSAAATSGARADHPAVAGAGAGVVASVGCVHPNGG